MNRTITCVEAPPHSGIYRLHDDHGWTCYLRLRRTNDGNWRLTHLPDRVFQEVSNAVIRDLQDQAVPCSYLIEGVKAVVKFLR